MSEANWEALASIARAQGCASWRVLLRRIATGDLQVVATLAPGAVPVVWERVEQVPPSLRGPDKPGFECSEPESVTLARHRDLAARRHGAPLAKPSGSL